MADRRYETLVLIHPDQGEPGSKESRLAFARSSRNRVGR